MSVWVKTFEFWSVRIEDQESRNGKLKLVQRRKKQEPLTCDTPFIVHVDVHSKQAHNV